MLEESNNVIAENLARHVAIAMRQQPSFSGGAAAVTSVLHRLGVTGAAELCTTAAGCRPTTGSRQPPWSS